MRFEQGLCICVLISCLFVCNIGRIPAQEEAEDEVVSPMIPVLAHQAENVSVLPSEHVLCMLPEERDPDAWRQEFVDMVYQFDGLGSYQFGKKAERTDYERVKTYVDTLPEERGDLALELDCSGFVQLMYWIYTGAYEERLSSTYLINDGCASIEEKDLKPGDLGMMFPDGSYYELEDGTKYYEYESVQEWVNEDEAHSMEDVVQYANHVGIYIGRDAQGNKIWAHCNANTNGVTVGVFDRFVCYYRVME